LEIVARTKERYNGAIKRVKEAIEYSFERTFHLGIVFPLLACCLKRNNMNPCTNIKINCNIENAM